MQILMSLVMMMVIGGVVALLLTFGFALFIWFLIMATMVSAYVMIRQAWYRRKGGFTESSESLGIIEGSYKDISEE